MLVIGQHCGFTSLTKLTMMQNVVLSMCENKTHIRIGITKFKIFIWRGIHVSSSQLNPISNRLSGDILPKKIL